MLGQQYNVGVDNRIPKKRKSKIKTRSQIDLRSPISNNLAPKDTAALRRDVQAQLEMLKSHNPRSRQNIYEASNESLVSEMRESMGADRLSNLYQHNENGSTNKSPMRAGESLDNLAQRWSLTRDPLLCLASIGTRSVRAIAASIKKSETQETFLKLAMLAKKPGSNSTPVPQHKAFV